MASTTSALPDGTKLTKPAYSDSADIAVLNTNMDNIANNINLINSNIVDTVPSKLTSGTGLSGTVSIPNNGRHLMIVSGAGLSRYAFILVNINSSGGCNIQIIYKGDSITLTEGTNAFTFSMTGNSTAIKIADFALQGEFATVTITDP